MSRLHESVAVSPIVGSLGGAWSTVWPEGLSLHTPIRGWGEDGFFFRFFCGAHPPWLDGSWPRLACSF